ncbi:MAG: hypothetical protein JKY52_04940 [Flavobacteriales bacterium]|nr:hypothetical protein [Flavobacteriales bacterium]
METINFRQKRDFGEILSATFTFIRVHFLSMFKPILVIAGIPLIIGAVWMGMAMSSMFNVAVEGGPIGSDFGLGASPVPFMVSLLPAYVLLIVGFLSFYIVINTYIAMYVAGEEPTLSAIFSEYSRTFWSYLGGGIVFMILVTIGMMFCGIPGIFVWVNFVLMFIVISVEKDGAMVAIGRSGKLMKGQWWDSFGLYIIVGLIQTIIAGVFSMPMYIIQFSAVFHDMAGSADDPMAAMESMQNMGSWMAVYLPIYYFGTMLTNMLLITAVALKYFSLVEMKEGVGDMERIESIGD